MVVNYNSLLVRIQSCTFLFLTFCLNFRTTVSTSAAATGNSIYVWLFDNLHLSPCEPSRNPIGLLYNKAYGTIKSTCFLIFFFFFFCKCNSLVKWICSLERVTVVLLLLLLSGDVELNPGPNSQIENNISILHCHIRSIDYILNIFEILFSFVLRKHILIIMLLI